MATYHFTLKSGKTMRAAAHCDYIYRQGKYKDISHGDEEKDLVVTGHYLPNWADKKPRKFFAMADKCERKNGVSYKEFEFALPNELTIKQNLEIVEQFLDKYMKNKCYCYAIHDKKNSSIENKRNIHCHIMFSERVIDKTRRSPEQFFKRYNSKNPEKGGAKKDRTFTDYKTRSENLKEARKFFEEITNLTLKKYGFKERVSCETLKEQQKKEKNNIIKYFELDRKPEAHINYIILRRNKNIKNNIIERRKLIKNRAIKLMQKYFMDLDKNYEKNSEKSQEKEIKNNQEIKINNTENTINNKPRKQKIFMKFNNKNNGKNNIRSR